MFVCPELIEETVRLQELIFGILSQKTTPSNYVIFRFSNSVRNHINAYIIIIIPLKTPNLERCNSVVPKQGSAAVF